MATCPGWTHNSGGYYFSSVFNFRSWTDGYKRDSKAFDMEEKAVGVEHRVDGPCLVARNIIHDNPRHETALREA